MDQKLRSTVNNVHDYWNAHTLGFQYVTDATIQPGTPEFFAHIRPWMNPYKFPWIMDRIEREAKLLKGKHLLEIGCGMGYDSLEFLKRGVRVTATDLTPNAVKMTLQHFAIENVKAEAVRTANALDLPFYMPLATPAAPYKKHAAFSSQVDAPSFRISTENRPGCTCSIILDVRILNIRNRTHLLTNSTQRQRS
jgi:SAM-dependent methyltransferase